ncbi:MAG: alpha/beta hydrolase [Paracoccaceae bacterium]
MTALRGGPSPGRAKAGLVMLHGRGGSAADILSLALRAAIPDAALIAPEAEGNTRWPTSFLAPSAAMEPFVRCGLAAVRDAVAALQGEGLARQSIWLLGFSQGACLALEAFARDGEGLAGAIAMSGGLVGTGDAEGGPSKALYGHMPKRFAYPGARAGSDVWLSCHERDPHIPLARVGESAAVLKGLGASVETKLYPGAGHGVMGDDIAAIRARVNR